MRGIFGCLSNNYSSFFIVFGRGTGCWLSFKRLCFPGNGAPWFYSRSHSQGPIIVLKGHCGTAGCVSKCQLAPWLNGPTVCGGFENSIHYLLSTNPSPFSHSEKKRVWAFLSKMCFVTPSYGCFKGGWRAIGGCLWRGSHGPVCMALASIPLLRHIRARFLSEQMMNME